MHTFDVWRLSNSLIWNLFVDSIICILGLDLVCPYYSVFSRPAKGLSIPMKKLLKPGGKINVVFDSTGIKVFGEMEWKFRKHGYSKRRTWRKVHIGMRVDSGQVLISAMGSNNVTDEKALIHMMEALEGIPLGDVLGDGLMTQSIVVRQSKSVEVGRLFLPIRMQNCRRKNLFHVSRNGKRQSEEFRTLERRDEPNANGRSELFRQNDAGRSLSLSQKSNFSYGRGHKARYIKSNERTQKAKKLQVGKLVRPTSGQLCCSLGIAYQSRPIWSLM